MIVVGVDGSVASAAALDWAIAEAARREESVLAVMVHLPQGQLMIGAVPYDVLPPSGIAAEHADCVRRLAETVAEADPAGVTVDQMVTSGKPGEELVKLAATADLLVVGSHGARFPEFLLGSVSSYCVRHAACPVVVLPRQAWEAAKKGAGHGSADAARN